ncbi:MAG: DUF4124 domain-containing protein [Methylococcaceae bacterium]|nr:DUF4124 domain-containing protein [Methylococcaceae bacterium]
MLKKYGAGLIVWFLWLPGLYATEVFVWNDAHGNRHYSDQRQADASALSINPGAGYYWVDKVYDGDTVLLSHGPKVRLLGINTPEVSGRYKAAEHGGQEAKAWLTQRLAGQKIRLEGDVEAEDHYQRRLGYLFDEQGHHINVELVRYGLAMVSVFPPNLKYLSALLEAQRQAESEHLGVWAYPEYAVKDFQALNSDNMQGWQRLSGRVIAVKQGEKHRYLQFSEQVAVKIPEQFQHWFSNLDQYQGKRIEARGWVQKQAQRFSLTVRHPSEIHVLD